MKVWSATVVLLVCSLLAGCEDPTIWSVESRDPDGVWTARAHTVQHSGFGTDGVETVVEISRHGLLGGPTRVLAFMDDGKSMNLKMRWLDQSHLAVTYIDKPEVLYYQVVKTSGIEITVRNLAKGDAT